MLPETMICTAPAMVATPSVAINELTCSLTTTKPFTTPMVAPDATATAMAAHMFQPNWLCRTTTMMVDKFTAAPTDRS